MNVCSEEPFPARSKTATGKALKNSGWLTSTAGTGGAPCALKNAVHEKWGVSFSASATDIRW